MRPATKIAAVTAAFTAAVTASMAPHIGAPQASVAAMEAAPVGMYPASVDDPAPARHAAETASLAVTGPSVVAHKAPTRTVHRTVKKKVKVKTVHRSYPAVKTAGWQDTFARCVKKHESRGSYTAENPTSTASGAYQFIDGTWRGLARHLGFGQYAHAYQAPPALQDRAFFYSITHGGIHNWNGTHCGFGT